MENEKRTDRNSWAELDENRLSDILTASQIKYHGHLRDSAPDYMDRQLHHSDARQF